LAEEWEHVLEGEEVVGEWAFHIQGCPITLRIKVVRTTNPPDMYIGIANSLAYEDMREIPTPRSTPNRPQNSQEQSKRIQNTSEKQHPHRSEFT